MIEFFARLFSRDFMPHGHCYAWQPDVLWTNVIADLAIGLAYFTIPAALWTFVRKRGDLAFVRIFLLFAAFIFACGTTHLVAVYNVWHGAYRFAGLVKAVTAAVSVITAIVLWRLLPAALAIPSTRQLAEVNARLQAEVEERQRAESELRQLNDELEARVEERTDELQRVNDDLRSFASAVSHDLKEPLRMVAGHVGLLARFYGEAMDEQARKHMGFAVDGAKRMGAMIDDLLAFAQAATDPGRVELVDLSVVVRDCLAWLAEPIAQAEAEIDVGPLPQIETDPIAARHVITNLVQNALKYRGEGRARIQIRVRPEGDGCVVLLRDHGIGFSPEDAERIFEPLVRLHGRQSDPHGSGLGLAICKRLAERSGGALWVEWCEPGKGSEFAFRVGRRPDPLVRPGDSVRGAAPHG